MINFAIFSDSVDLPSGWVVAIVGMLTAFAVAATAIANVVLQVMAKIEAARVAKQAQEDALRAQYAANSAAAEVRKVTVTLAQTTATTTKKLDGLVEVADKTHVLVNSEHSKALEAVANLSRWKANQPGATDLDVNEARIAELALADHKDKPATVDAKE